MPRELTRLLVLAAAFLLLFAFPALVLFYTDWLWFGETGYQSVFLRQLTAKWLLWLAGFAVAAPFLWWNLRHALVSVPAREVIIMTPQGPRTLAMDATKLRPVVAGVAIVVALLLATRIAANWDIALLFWNSAPSGTTDPLLGHDIVFYLFSWPWLRIVQQSVFLLLVLTVIGVGAIHVLSGSLSLNPESGVVISRTARRHLTWLTAGLLLALVFGDWLGLRGLLLTPATIIQGAGYTDVHVRMPVYQILMAVGTLAALLAIVDSLRPRKWLLVGGIAAYVLVAVGGTAAAALFERFAVQPNQQVRETPYIRHNIQATREAFAVDDVVEQPLSGAATLSRQDIDANAATLRNVPLWDHQPLLDTFAQTQQLRTYYDFIAVHNDRYLINGDYRQIMLSARELNSESLPNRTWINERLTFTHGYGLALGPVNEATEEGLPRLFIRDLPPESDVDLHVDQPAIYYGQLSNDHVFVNTNTSEFDYPEGEENVFARYAGDGGVSVGSLLRKALFAIRFRSIRPLLSDDLTADSRVLYHRRVAERVEKIAPFLTYDSSPYLSIDEGRLYWVQDAYTTSRHYPYSRQVAPDNINYIRSSIKAVIDAYHGTTTFYLIDPDDPVAATLARAFPGLLRPLSEMPEGLRTRMRYPVDIFGYQTAVYAMYHMRNPGVFYNREDQWEVPTFDARGQSQAMEAYYTIMKLPGEEREEFIQMLPFTPRERDNLAAWMVARSDGEHYGRLAVFTFPKQKLIFGPRQIVARISQDQTISPQITLWNQQGSEVILGQLLVIPIEESLIYVRPLYLRASGGHIVELRRVIVAYENRIVMEDTLEDAIDRLFPREGIQLVRSADTEAPDAAPGAAPAAGVPEGQLPSDPATRALLAQAHDHFQRATAAQRAGDWARYGEEIEQLGAVLEKLAGTGGDPQ